MGSEGVQSPNHERRVDGVRGPARLPVFASLGYLDFRRLWVSTLASSTAFNMQMITRGWLVLGLANDSPLALSLVMMSFALPLTVVSPFGGALADRFPRKRIIILSQAGNAFITLVLATLDVTGMIRFWHLLAFGLLNGSLIGLNMPGRQAMISEMVPEERIMNAVSLNNSGMNLTRILGPSMAGVLIIFMGTAGVFYLISGAYLFAALWLRPVGAGSTASRRSGQKVTTDIVDGLAYVSREPTLLGLVVMAVLPTLFGFSYFALLPAWAREALDVGSEGLGLLMTMTGAGALAGTLALASLRELNRRGLVLLAASASWGVILALFSQAGSYGTALPMLFFLGLVGAVYMSLNMTLMQIYSTPEMRGRVMSLGIMTFGLMPLSAVPFGALAEVIGTPDALGISGLTLLGLTVGFALFYRTFSRIA